MVDRLETERLSLRGLTVDDVEELVALDADPQVMRYINGGKATSRAEVETTVRQSLDHRWMAFERSAGAFVGWFALRPSDLDGRERELGYRLRRQAWGQGFATEGSKALIELAFTRFGVHRVWAQTMTVNAASRRVMEHSGLRYVRTFFLEWPEPIDGTEQGDVEYELSKSDWEAAVPPR